MQPWMVIGGITLLVAIIGGSLTPSKGVKWFKRLRRPEWLTFEKAIPVIWTVVFVCGALSAIIVWNEDPGTPQTWGLMGLYLLLEIITLAYNPVMLFLRSLKVGTIIGGAGFLVAIALTLFVFPISGTAALLLVPYLIWSPIGTYTTWVMAQLNPSEA